EQQYIQMDTTNILFICGGTFVGLPEIIKRRLGKRRIGFASTMAHSDMAKETGEVLSQVTPDDLLQYGMIPELLGRLPVLTPLMPLGVDALIQVLTEPKNALIKQYQHMFSLEGAMLTFTDEALTTIAKKALVRETGARALRAVVD